MFLLLEGFPLPGFVFSLERCCLRTASMVELFIQLGLLVLAVPVGIEFSHHARQVTRLLFNGLGGGRSFFHQRGILLRHAFELGDRAVYLLNVRRLLDRGSGNLGNYIRGLFDAGYDRRQRFASGID